MKMKRTKDKRDDLTFPIVIFPFISSNIPAWPARVCASNYDLWWQFMYLHTFRTYSAYPSPPKKNYTWNYRDNKQSSF